MISKTLIILAATSFVSFGALSAHAADGRDKTLYPDHTPQMTIFEGRNVALPVDRSVVNNERAAIRDQIEGNARSTH